MYGAPATADLSLVPRQVRCRRRTVHLFQGRHDVAHRRLRRDPSVVDVREVEFTVLALLPAGEANGAPETLRSEEHTSELQSRLHLVCRLLLEKKKKNKIRRVKPRHYQ